MSMSDILLPWLIGGLPYHIARILYDPYIFNLQTRASSTSRAPTPSSGVTSASGILCMAVTAITWLKTFLLLRRLAGASGNSGWGVPSAQNSLITWNKLETYKLETYKLET